MKNQAKPNSSSQPKGRPARSKRPSASRTAAPIPTPRDSWRDPLGYTPLRVVSGGGGAGAPARPPRGVTRRRNRRRIPPVVLWNRRMVKLRNLSFTILLAVVVFLCLASPRLEVRHITVSGASIREPQAVVKAAGLARPGNIFRAPAGRAEKRLSALPEVASAQVQRHLPRTLGITVTERRAVATVLTRNGCWWMDSGGLVFRQVGKPLANQPILVVSPRKIVVGKELPLVALPAALDCLAQLPDLPLARNVRLYVDDTQEAWLNNPDGFKIRLGPLDNAPERLALTGRLLNGPDGADLMRKAIALDMTTPNSEVYRLRRSGGAPASGA